LRDIFWEDFFGRHFLGGFFWEDYLGGLFWEEFFGRNYLVEINKELMFLQDFGVILSQCTGRKKFRSLEVRGKLIALKKLSSIVHAIYQHSNLIIPRFICVLKNDPILVKTANSK
jgi:hypothetical protein